MSTFSRMENATIIDGTLVSGLALPDTDAVVSLTNGDYIRLSFADLSPNKNPNSPLILVFSAVLTDSVGAPINEAGTPLAENEPPVQLVDKTLTINSAALADGSVDIDTEFQRWFDDTVTRARNWRASVAARSALPGGS